MNTLDRDVYMNCFFIVGTLEAWHACHGTPCVRANRAKGRRSKVYPRVFEERPFIALLIGRPPSGRYIRVPWTLPAICVGDLE